MDRLIKILRAVKPGVDLENNDALVEEGILDSLDIVEIVSEIEKEYGIEILPDQIDPDNFQSVAAMWEMIGGMTGENGD